MRRSGLYFKDLGISKRSLDVVREGMNRVTNVRRGTAYRAQDLRRRHGNVG